MVGWLGRMGGRAGVRRQRVEVRECSAGWLGGGSALAARCQTSEDSACPRRHGAYRIFATASLLIHAS